MKKWQYPSDYSGPDYKGYYIVYSRNRDSDLLSQSNFAEFERQLQCENWNDRELPETPMVINVQHRHWAVGWIEFILIHEKHPLIDLAKQLTEQLESYPVLNDLDYSERQTDAIIDYWMSLDLSNKVKLCSVQQECIFAARHDSPPERVWNLLSDEIY